WLVAAALVVLTAGAACADQPPAAGISPLASPEAQSSPSDAPASVPADKLSAPEKQSPIQTQSVCQTFRVRPQDQVWLGSTRHLGCPSGKYDPPVQLCRYESGRWQPATLAEFYATDSADVVTPIYVHGNLIDANLAVSYGLSVYFELVGKFDAEPPARFVIW